MAISKDDVDVETKIENVKLEQVKFTYLGAVMMDHVKKTYVTELEEHLPFSNA